MRRIIKKLKRKIKLNRVTIVSNIIMWKLYFRNGWKAETFIRLNNSDDNFDDSHTCKQK